MTMTDTRALSAGLDLRYGWLILDGPIERRPNDSDGWPVTAAKHITPTGGIAPELVASMDALMARMRIRRTGEWEMTDRGDYLVAAVEQDEYEEEMA